MNTVNQYLCDLLYDHDCVIVPRLGGFLVSYNGAKLHPVHHTISPPSRNVSFNVFLKQNDGLLAKHFSEAENISYAEALFEIEKYVNSCQRELSEGEKIIIEDVGVLYYDREQNLQFEPIGSANFLRDSFGLAPVQFLPVTHDNKQKAHPVPDLKSIRPSIKSKKARVPVVKSNVKNLVSGFMIAAAVLWMGVNAYLVFKKDHPVTAAMSDSSKINEAQVAQPDLSLQASIESTASILPVPSTNHSTAQEPQVNQQEQAVAISEAQEPVPVVQPADIETSEKYFVIAGAFRIASNAEGFVNELQSKGFRDARIISSHHPLTLVCYESCATRQEAFALLDSLRKGNHDGWIFSK